MLFKSDVPMSHRVTFFLAGIYTANPLIKWGYGFGFHTKDLLPIGLFWFIVIYQWHERKSLKWVPVTSAEARHGMFDSLQSKYDEAAFTWKAAYWILMVLVAIGIYFLFTLRG